MIPMYTMNTTWVGVGDMHLHGVAPRVPRYMNGHEGMDSEGSDEDDCDSDADSDSVRSMPSPPDDLSDLDDVGPGNISEEYADYLHDDLSHPVGSSASETGSVGSHSPPQTPPSQLASRLRDLGARLADSELSDPPDFMADETDDDTHETESDGDLSNVGSVEDEDEEPEDDYYDEVLNPPQLPAVPEERLQEAWTLGEASFSIFLCPITHDVMSDPVVSADGYTYERAAIARWFETSRKSPVTNQSLPHTDLVPNHSVRTLLKALIDMTEPAVPAVGTGSGGSGGENAELEEAPDTAASASSHPPPSPTRRRRSPRTADGGRQSPDLPRSPSEQARQESRLSTIAAVAAASSPVTLPLSIGAEPRPGTAGSAAAAVEPQRPRLRSAPVLTTQAPATGSNAASSSSAASAATPRASGAVAAAEREIEHRLGERRSLVEQSRVANQHRAAAVARRELAVTSAVFGRAYMDERYNTFFPLDVEDAQPPRIQDTAAAARQGASAAAAAATAAAATHTAVAAAGPATAASGTVHNSAQQQPHQHHNHPHQQQPSVQRSQQGSSTQGSGTQAPAVNGHQPAQSSLHRSGSGTRPAPQGRPQPPSTALPPLRSGASPPLQITPPSYRGSGSGGASTPAGMSRPPPQRPQSLPPPPEGTVTPTTASVLLASNGGGGDAVTTNAMNAAATQLQAPTGAAAAAVSAATAQGHHYGHTSAPHPGVHKRSTATTASVASTAAATTESLGARNSL